MRFLKLEILLEKGIYLCEVTCEIKIVPPPSHKFKNAISLYKKSLAQEEGYGACFSREGSAEVKSENRS